MKCNYCSTEFKKKAKTSKYCSLSCYHKSMEKHTVITCAQCNQEQERPTYRVTSKNCFCSKECQYLFQSGVNCNLYNEGGTYLCATSGFRYVLVGKKFRSEHRVIVEREINRSLNHYGEPILHINGNKSCNDIDNLYVCESNSEMTTILNTMNAPYPYKSNIHKLKSSIKNKTYSES